MRVQFGIFPSSDHQRRSLLWRRFLAILAAVEQGLREAHRDRRSAVAQRRGDAEEAGIYRRSASTPARRRVPPAEAASRLPLPAVSRSCLLPGCLSAADAAPPSRGVEATRRGSAPPTRYGWRAGAFRRRRLPLASRSPAHREARAVKRRLDEGGRSAGLRYWRRAASRRAARRR